MDVSSNAAYASLVAQSRTPDEDTGVVLLQQERDRLQQAVTRLEDSNRELQSALLKEGEDPDYRQAIGVRLSSTGHLHGVPYQVCK
jgi:uncharacterized protein YlxW (UPF0749 family)